MKYPCKLSFAFPPATVRCVAGFILAIVGFALTADAADGLPDQLVGDGLTVRFTDKSATPGGTLELGGKTYPFAGRIENNQLVGTFKAGETSFPFTLSQNAAGFTLETGTKRYALQPVGAPQPAVPQIPPANPQAGRGPDLTYAPQQVIDPKTKLVVGTLVAPKGWMIDPGILWRPMDAQFVAMGTAIYDPKTRWAVRWIPVDQFSANPALYDNAIRQGAAPKSLGGIEYTKSSPSAASYIRGIVLPRYRNIPDLKIVKVEDLPKLATAVERSQPHLRWSYQQGGRELSYTAARMRVEYASPDGMPLEEEIICVLNTSWSPQDHANARTVGMPPAYFFTPDRLFSYTAPKGQLDAAMPHLEPIVLSFRIDRTWVKFTENIQGQITAIVNDQYAMEAAARKQITQSQMKTVEESWKAANRQSREVGGLLSGTTPRQDPNNPQGPPINGPAGKVSWTNPRGEWKHLEPNDDPNTHPGSTKDWVPAKGAPA